jgi:hypothetical protein
LPSTLSFLSPTPMPPCTRSSSQVLSIRCGSFQISDLTFFAQRPRSSPRRTTARLIAALSIGSARTTSRRSFLVRCSCLFVTISLSDPTLGSRLISQDWFHRCLMYTYSDDFTQTSSGFSLLIVSKKSGALFASISLRISLCLHLIP